MFGGWVRSMIKLMNQHLFYTYYEFDNALVAKSMPLKNLM